MANLAATHSSGLGSFHALTERHRVAGWKRENVLMCLGRDERGFLSQPGLSTSVVPSSGCGQKQQTKMQEPKKMEMGGPLFKNY